MDREETLRRAEKLLRQGRLDAAIDQYVSVVDAQPRDWTTANLLGDLYIRAGRTDRAVAQYARIADLLAADGFLSKAAALYKKIVKISPQDETAMVRAAELSAQQGLLADARSMLQTVFQRRVRAGDRVGAGQVARRHASLDPNDVVGRLEGARMLAEIGEVVGAASHLRLAGDMLAGQGRTADALRTWREAVRLNPSDTQAQERVTNGLLQQGDLDGALASAQSASERKAIAHAMLKAGRESVGRSLLEQVLEAAPADLETRLELARMSMDAKEFDSAAALLKPGLGSGDPRVDLALAEAELRSNRIQVAGDRLKHLLAQDDTTVDNVAALGASLAEQSPDAAFAAVACVLDHLAHQQEFDRGFGILERFEAAVPGYLPALERHVELCRGGQFLDPLYQAESRLADAYLAVHRFADALPLAKRLAALRPDVSRHKEQLRDARVGTGQGEEARVPINAASQEPAFDLAEFAASLGLAAHADGAEPERGTPGAGAVSEAVGPQAVLQQVIVAEENVDSFGSEGLVELPEAEQEDAARADEEVYEIELGDTLESLASFESMEPGIPASASPDTIQAGAAAASGTPDLELEDVFRQMRQLSGRDNAEAEAMLAYDEASVHYNEGRFDQAAECLRRAGRDSSLRFRASVMLGRIAIEQGQTADAIAWFERASEAPASSVQAARALMYELATTLESAGELARAHAVLLELNAAEPGYRDVDARLERLGQEESTQSPDPGLPEGPA